MNINLDNVDKNDMHTTTGPTVRLDVVDNSTAAARLVLTIDEDTHFSYPPTKGASTGVTLKLATDVVHPASVVIAASELNGRRDYDVTITINGEPVVRTKDTIPEGSSEDGELGLFQLLVR